MDGTINVRLPSISLKVIVSVHFILTIWGDQIQWLPITYLLCNLLVLTVGVWAIAAPENSDASLMFLVGMLFTIIHDIIVFAIFYNSNVPGSHYKFCVGMAILSLILKPLSCLLIFQDHRNRGGEFMNKLASGNPYVTIEGHSAPYSRETQPSAPQN